MAELIGMELVEEFIESVIMTGRLKPPHSPVSVLLIASAESGKTSVAGNKKSSAIACFTDVTGRGLIEICKQSPEVSHIVLNDLVAIMSHRQSVNRYTQSMINAVTEEGISALAMPDGIEIVANGRRGIIACLTTDLAQDGRSWWNKIGLASRLLPFSFAHPGTLTIKIKDAIDNGKVDKGKKDILKVPRIPMDVKFPEYFVRKVRRMADEKAKELKDPTGYRRLKQFRALICGHALRRRSHKAEVNKADLDFVERVFPYISYDKVVQL